jgi:hypothetical protein
VLLSEQLHYHWDDDNKIFIHRAPRLTGKASLNELRFMCGHDDGGLSGGSMEWPALKRLLEDIKTGKVQIIVVYKVDRLTRSLSDFAKIVDVLDAYNASFVSVTQQFNTTTSMGRLTLKVTMVELRSWRWLEISKSNSGPISGPQTFPTISRFRTAAFSSPRQTPILTQRA